MSKYINKWSSLTPQIKAALTNAGLDKPRRASSLKLHETGTYLCRRCGMSLYRARDQFTTKSGYPSFAAGIDEHLIIKPNEDEQHQQVSCLYCQSHLGVFFRGERLSSTGLCHQINASAIDYVSTDRYLPFTRELIVAGGDFSCINYWIRQQAGVLKTEGGYIDGRGSRPTKDQVDSGTTGFAQALRIVFDPQVTNNEKLLSFFFCIHDPNTLTNSDDQSQYRSAVFYYDAKQHDTIQLVVDKLQAILGPVSTQIKPISVFWPADQTLQEQHDPEGEAPSSHPYVDRWQSDKN